MNIVLLGSNPKNIIVGKLLATKLEMTFFDTDSLIERKNKSKIDEILKTNGMGHFHNLETEILKICCHYDQIVLSTGKNVVFREKNIPMLKKIGEAGKIVHLSGNPNASTRKLLYQNVADVTIEMFRYCPKTIKRRIIDSLNPPI